MILSGSLFFHGSNMSKLMMPYLCSRQEEKGEKRIVPNTFFSLTRKVKLSPKAPALDKSLPQLRHISLSARMSGKVDNGWLWLIYTIKIHSMGWGHISTPIKIKVLLTRKRNTHCLHMCAHSLVSCHFCHQKPQGRGCWEVLQSTVLPTLFPLWSQAQPEPGTPPVKWGNMRTHVVVPVFRGTSSSSALLHGDQQAYLIPQAPSELSSKTFWWLQSEQQRLFAHGSHTKLFGLIIEGKMGCQ